MNRFEMKSMLPIITAFAEGKPVEYKLDDGTWVEALFLQFNNEADRYRLKPEASFRPFKGPGEFKEHRDRWIGQANAVGLCRVCGYNEFGVYLAGRTSIVKWTALATSHYWFDDHAPCGVLITDS